MQLTVVQIAQTRDGNKPVHYVSEEHQDWLVFDCLPACEDALATILASAGSDVRHRHDKLQQRINWDEGKMGRKWYGLACDRAGVHSWTSWSRYRKGEKRVDRRTIKRGNEGWIPVARCQSIPQAPKMQDSTESAVEMVIRRIKHFAHAYLDSLPGTEPLTWRDLVEANKRGVEQGATLEHVQKCWEHMRKACRIMSATRDTKLKLEARGKMRTVEGTDGGPVPRPFNG